MGSSRESDAFAEKAPFLARSQSQPRSSRLESAGLSSYFDKIDHSPGASILAYCLSSISMTVVNKYVVSGSDWNLNFFYLAVQVCDCLAKRRIIFDLNTTEPERVGSNLNLHPGHCLHNSDSFVQATRRFPKPRSFRFGQGEEM